MNVDSLAPATPALVHALIGCGRIAPSHIDAFSAIPGVRLKYVCASESAHATEFAKKFRIPFATNVLTQVLEDPEVNSISILTPHDLHGPMILEALRFGKHALVEKPFVIHSGELNQIQLATKRSPRLCVAPVSQHRFDPLVRELARLVMEGELGTLLVCRAHLECFRPIEYYLESNWRGTWAREGGSVLINQAYHLLDLMIWLGGSIESVSAHMQTRIYRGRIETEESLSATMQFTSGALGGLTISGAAGATWFPYLELIGTKGVIAFDIGYPNRVHRIQFENRRALLAAKKILNQITVTREAPPPGLSYFGTSHRGQATAFINTLRNGTPDPYSADIVQAGKVVQTIQSLYQSAREQTQITLQTSYEPA